MRQSVFTKSSMLTSFLVAMMLVAIIAVFQSFQLDQLTRSNDTSSVAQLKQREEGIGFKLQIWKNIPTFGFRNLLADWTFLDFLQYFGDTKIRRQIGYEISPDFFKVIIDRDPLFIETYLYLTNTVSMYAGQPETAVELLEQGLNYMSPTVPKNSYLVWRYKGTDELLFLGNSDAAQQSFATAADWARALDTPESLSMADLSQQTADFLAQDPDSQLAQINAWMQVLLRAVDDQVREIAVTNIEALDGEIVVTEGGQVTVRYRLQE